MKTKFLKRYKTGAWMLIALIAVLISSCSKDDGPSNQAPEKALLLNPSNQAKDLEPGEVTLKWQAATDPNDDTVSYDIYLDTIHPPEAKIMADLSETSLKLSKDLEYDKTYFWSVTSKDKSGTESNSNIGTFSTRERTTEELLIGKWIITGYEWADTPQSIDCQGMSYFQFDTEGKFSMHFFNGDNCNTSDIERYEFTVPGASTINIRHTETSRELYLSILSLSETSLSIAIGVREVYHLEREQ